MLFEQSNDTYETNDSQTTRAHTLHPGLVSVYVTHVFESLRVGDDLDAVRSLAVAEDEHASTTLLDQRPEALGHMRLGRLLLVVLRPDQTVHCPRAVLRETAVICNSNMRVLLQVEMTSEDRIACSPDTSRTLFMYC